MVIRLIADLMRREAAQSVFWILLLMLWWPPAAAGNVSRATLLAVSMSAAFYIGFALVHRLAAQELFLLPVSTRQLWLTRWWTATVIASAIAAVPKLLFPFEGMAFTLLSMLCDFAYTGACLALWPVFDLRPRGPLWFRILTIRAGMIVWVLTIGGGAVAWTFALRPLLPTTWADLQGGAGLLVLGALLLTARGYLHRPAPGVTRGLVRTRGSGSISPVSSSGRQPMGRLTGVAYLLQRDAKVALLYALLVVSGVLLVTLFQRTPASLPALAAQAARVLFPGPGELFGRSAWLVLMIACVPAGLFWHAVLRHVRTLPISTPRLIALLVAVPLSRWVAVWLLVAAGFLLQGRAPARLGLDTLAAFTGIAALMQAVGLRWNNNRHVPVVAAVMAASLALIVAAVRFADGIEAIAAALGLSVAALVGGVTLAAAMLLHYDTLTRRAATYRMPHVGVDEFTPGIS